MRYQDFFGPGAGMSGSLATNLPDGIWQMARNSPGRMTLCLVNMTGVKDRDWNKDHAAPIRQRDVSVRVAIDQPMAQVYWSSPDGQDLRLLPVPWRVGEPIIEVAVPELAYWGILVFVFGVEDKG